MRFTQTNHVLYIIGLRILLSNTSVRSELNGCAILDVRARGNLRISSILI